MGCRGAAILSSLDASATLSSPWCRKGDGNRLRAATRRVVDLGAEIAFLPIRRSSGGSPIDHAWSLSARSASRDPTYQTLAPRRTPRSNDRSGTPPHIRRGQLGTHP